jgi:hypothetical protein
MDYDFYDRCESPPTKLVKWGIDENEKSQCARQYYSLVRLQIWS